MEAGNFSTPRRRSRFEERRKRELRALLPREQEPWAPGPSRSSTSSLDAEWIVSGPLAHTEIDTFGTLPVKSPVSARELFHYCKWNPHLP